MRIFFFGDSITQGFFDSRGGWAQRIASHYHSVSSRHLDKEGGAWVECFNLGVSGDNAQGVLDRMESEIKVRQLDEQENVIIIAVGVNDAVQRENQAVMDVYTFQEIIEKIIDIAKKYGDKVMCVGLSAVDESLTDPWAGSRSGKQWHNQRINVFEDTIKQSAARTHVSFVPIHDQFLAELEKGRELLSDGLHPNNLGHELITSIVKPELEKLLA